MRPKATSSEFLFNANFLYLWFGALTAFASFHILIPILPLYIVSVGGTESQIGLIVGILTVTSVSVRPWIGRQADRRGKKLILMWGTLGFMISAVFYNLAASVILLLILRLFHGVAWAGTSTGSTAMVADIAPLSRRGEAIGWYGTASNVAMAVAPLAAGFLVKDYGYGTIFAIASVLAFITLAAYSRVREPARTSSHTGPPAGQPSSASSWRDLVYRPALFPAIILLSVTLTYGVLIPFLPVLAVRHNINPGLFFATYAIFVILVRPLGGKISDKAGRSSVIIPGIAAISVAMGLLAFANDLPHFLIAGAIYGIGFALANPALMALAVDRAAPEARGAAMGTISAGFDLGIGIGAIILGFLLEKTNFQVMFLAAAGIAAVNIITYLVWPKKS